MTDGTVLICTFIGSPVTGAPPFEGEQFVLWWEHSPDRSPTEGGQSLTAWKTQMETVRTNLNHWIMSKESGFDGVIDFDGAMQGGGTRSGSAVILPAMWSCDDNVHPNMAGYRQMAKAIEITLFNISLRSR